jgi:L-alanine-DL-glutamate epimerase-like enolase superfamily enzyme
LTLVNHREYALVRVRSSDGVEGWAYGLTRDGEVAAQLRRTVAPSYLGSAVGEMARTWSVASRANLASNGSGIGLRALSLVDLASWDLAARSAGVSIAQYLGGAPGPLPAIACVGYGPPGMPEAAVEAEAIASYQDGWRRLKLPGAPSEDETVGRLSLVRAALPSSWLAIDLAWCFETDDPVIRFAHRVADLELGWLEDAVPPGDAALLSRIRGAVGTPIAQGDEQGGPYFPEALLMARAVDVVRLDVTCVGGLTPLPDLISKCEAAGSAVSLHVFGHVHARIVNGLGKTSIPVEWFLSPAAEPWGATLEKPTISEGIMQPLRDEVGFGELVDLEWASHYAIDDRDGLFGGRP